MNFKKKNATYTWTSVVLEDSPYYFGKGKKSLVNININDDGQSFTATTEFWTIWCQCMQISQKLLQNETNNNSSF